MDVSKNVRINCLLKVGGSGADSPEVIFVMQLLEMIIESFHTGSFVKHSGFAAPLTLFFICALKIVFDVNRITFGLPGSLVAVLLPPCCHLVAF